METDYKTNIKVAIKDLKGLKSESPFILITTDHTILSASRVDVLTLISAMLGGLVKHETFTEAEIRKFLGLILKEEEFKAKNMANAVSEFMIYRFNKKGRKEKNAND